MIAVKIVVFGIIGLLFSIGMIAPSFAHTTVYVEQYEIEAGWGVEPPVVGIRNEFMLKIIERGEKEGTFTGVTNAFKNVDVTAMFGGATKKIEVNSDPRPGYYFSPVIPTKTGTYMIELKGEIHGVPVDIKIPIEDVEPTAVLDFPPTSSEGTADVAALKNAISSLQQDVSKLKSGETEVASDGGAAYDFAIFGLSIAGAAIILAIVALVKRK
ncbi:hypothetical protein AAA799E16_00394 [Marine Group I thaumarchaeote SCGC AAA799-E16]|uniref:Uncharacterized protein n=3 Tax=Marine Group I TaxID=905826 RepID=A0A087RN15_9ARCH|nr:hypothetical protein AAA799E16_00394 [Marine Group I thaumarchaeote SCGC AAA799-E16]KFM14869.1 hypothetical protein AAA799D11_01575 [Marine Group I thaumarchaeote SCGC AAA799-D11]KFM17638.1 hypothetical protein SCCGRSA3_01568 [Marine Group I thaumarchaeote SCGC RSA3]